MIDVPVDIEVKKGLTPYLTELSGLRRSLNVYPKDDELISLKQLRPEQVLYDTWPWPQMFKLGHHVFVCSETSISVIRPHGIELLLGGIESRGYPWGAAIVGNFPVFVNSVAVVHPDSMAPLANRRVDFAWDEFNVQTSEVPIGRDICQFNSQFVVAAPWMYGKWHPDHVVWAVSGTIDFSISPQKSSGLRFVQGCGAIMRVVEHYDGFVAYGEEGVMKFTAAEYPASYRAEKISDVGLYSQLAVTRGTGFHFFLGTDRCLYSITNGVKKLGYDYIFGKAGSEVSLHYDEQEAMVYASF